MICIPDNFGLGWTHRPHRPQPTHVRLRLQCRYRPRNPRRGDLRRAFARRSVRTARRCHVLRALRRLRVLGSGRVAGEPARVRGLRRRLAAHIPFLRRFISDSCSPSRGGPSCTSPARCNSSGIPWTTISDEGPQGMKGDKEVTAAPQRGAHQRAHRDQPVLPARAHVPATGASTGSATTSTTSRSTR